MGVSLQPGAGVANPVLNVPSSNTGYPVLKNSLVHPLEIAPAINGMRGDGVYFSLDGVNQVTGGPFPNPDATREFSIVSSTFAIKLFAEDISAPVMSQHREAL